VEGVIREIDFDQGIVWWILAAMPIGFLGIVLYRLKVISARILVYIFSPMSILMGNLAAIWKAAPNLNLGLKLLLVICLTLFESPFIFYRLLYYKVLELLHNDDRMR
jgi:hypothetical protein